MAGKLNTNFKILSLVKQAAPEEELANFENYIAERQPEGLTFTDPEVRHHKLYCTNSNSDIVDLQADPFICGHRGHSMTSCGYRFKAFFEIGGAVTGKGDDNHFYD